MNIDLTDFYIKKKTSLILHISHISSVVSTVNWRILLCAMTLGMNSISEFETKRQGTNTLIGILAFGI